MSVSTLLRNPFKIMGSIEGVISPEPNEISKKLQDFNEMREKGEQCDVFFSSKGALQPNKRVWAHKLIVHHASPYCAKLISEWKKQSPVEIIMDCTDQTVLDKIVSYMYTGELTVLLSKVEIFYAVSHTLQLGKVKEECIRLLTTNALAQPATALQRKPDALDPTTVIGEFWYGALSRIFKSFVICIESDEFGQIPVKQASCWLFQWFQFKSLVELFLSHTSQPDTKLISYAVNTWINHSRPTRYNIVDWLMKTLRRDNVPHETIEAISSELVAKVANTSTNDVTDVDESSDVAAKQLNGRINPSKKRLSDFEAASLSQSFKVRVVDELPTVVEDYVMIFIEGDGTGKRSLWKFDFAKTKFTAVMAMPNPSDAQISQEEIVCAGGKIYAIGGLNSKTGQTSELVFTADLKDSSKWTQCPNLNISRKEFTAVVYEDFIYVIGGTNTKNSRGSLSSVERLNFKQENSRWLFVANMEEPRVSCRSAVLHDHIFVVGGKQNKGVKKVLNSVEVYDAVNNIWTTIANTWIPRAEFGLVSCMNQLFVIGGHNDEGVLNSVEVYDPGTNKWSFTQNLMTKRKYPGAISLPVQGGKIFVFGGYDKNSVRIASSELYHPRLCSWEEYVTPEAITSSFRTVIVVKKREMQN